MDRCGTMANCIVWANSGAGDYGAGGIGVINITAWSKFNIVNCTVVGNSSTTKGGGVFLSSANVGADDGHLVNNIIAFNTAPEGADICIAGDQNLRNNSGYNCLCPTETYGVNPQTGDPLFKNPEKGDFHLMPESPARNAGDKEKAASALGRANLDGMLDFYGLDRVVERVVDIGAAEWKYSGGLMLIFK